MAESKLTPELERYLTERKATHKRLTRFDSLAKSHGMSKGDAKAILNAFRGKYGERVRGEVEQRQVPKVMRKWHEVAVDGTALAFGVGISLVLNIVVFFLISPDWITAIGMVCLAPIVVLFSVRGWIKGGVIGKSLWAMFVIVEVFSGISFALASTDLQARTERVDTELVRLTAKVEHDQKDLDTLQAGYNSIGEGFRSELTVRQSAIAEARKAIESSEDARRNYLATKPTSGKGAVLTSDKVFNAIPDAIASGRWIQTVFFTLIFCGLALTVISAATSTTREKE
jgi:hypothetical protein